MVLDAGKVTGATEEVAMEEVDAVEEDMVVILIYPTTSGTALTFKRFIGISAVTIGMLFSKTVKNMLAINAYIQRMLEDTVTTAHEGDVATAEDDRSQKLILIGMTPFMDDVIAEDAVHRMEPDFEEEHIGS